MKRIAFISNPGLSNFLVPVVHGFKKKGYSTTLVDSGDINEIWEAIRDNEIVWLEWADDLAVRLTTDPMLLNQRSVILRVHSREAFVPYIKYINWDRIDQLIFVSHHIKELVLEEVPKILEVVGEDNIYVVPNGVDLDKCEFIPRSKGFDIAYVGYINFKKGPMLLMQALKAICDNDPRYRIHVAGTFQEKRYELYFKQFVEDNGLEDNFIFDGWISDVGEWLKDKQYILSTSVLESQGMGILEAMAAGCKPLIHNFVGAKNLYSADYIWTSVTDLSYLLDEPVRSEYYRSFVEDFYSFRSTIDLLESIVVKCWDKSILRIRDEGGDEVPVSVVMMVKDEEKNLPTSLDSIKDFADEIIVVDTGSSDNSINICGEFGAKVYERTWENFAEHRNQVMDLAQYEWVFQLDADERFVGDGRALKRALNNIYPESDVVMLWLDNIDEVGITTFRNKQPRLLRKSKVKYQCGIHNEVVCNKKTMSFYDEAYLNHYGYTSADMPMKFERTVSLLEKELHENPKRTKVLFYLFQSYCVAGMVEEGIPFGEKYLEYRNSSPDFNNSIFAGLVSIYIRSGNLGRAREILAEGFRVVPGDLDLARLQVSLGLALNDGWMTLEGSGLYREGYAGIGESGLNGGRFLFSYTPQDWLTVAVEELKCYSNNALKSYKGIKRFLHDNPGFEEDVEVRHHGETYLQQIKYHKCDIHSGG